MSLTPLFIAGSSIGLEQDKKPFMLPDQAFSALENAYVWRERVKKRDGLQLLGKLRRILTLQGLGVTPAANTLTFANIFTTLGIIGENPEIEPGSLIITIVAPDASTFTDQGDGTFSVTGKGLAAGSYINYATGQVVLNFNVVLVGGAAITADLNYYPGLPVMGIIDREKASINDEEVIFFDTKYAYKFVVGFQEFIAGTTWAGTDSDFFWGANYRGVTADVRLLFVTNNVVDAADAIRYTDGSTWTNFSPLVSANNTLFQARIIIPYFGRLLFLNVWEGTTAGGYAAATNFFNRCRFSQIGNPVAIDAWRSDTFGKGGFIDAPTNEAIISASFYKNTLIVGFERSTWQLRYVGEYGLPFIWERISSDFGTESTFSSVIFDQGVASIGDRAIVSATSNNVQRIDEQIPDIVFSFKNADDGTQRIQGIRDFQRELVFWSYNDSIPDSVYDSKFPNAVLVYNYRNNTYAQFRDNVTAFGTFQPQTGITWDRTDIFWDNEKVTWTDSTSQSLFPFIVCGNQQGYIHYYGYTTPDESSLSITAVDLTVSPIKLTIKNHNLEDGEIIYLSGLQFVDSIAFTPLSTDLNDKIFRVEIIDGNNLTISFWETTSTPHMYVNNFSFTPVTTALYIGGGSVALFPVMNIQTKDFNPFQVEGKQLKLAYIDFLTDCTPSAVMSIELFANASPSIIGNLLVGNKELETYMVSPFYPGTTPATPVSDYLWHRFYATLAAQYIRLRMFYDDDLMNDLSTHQQTWVLNAMCLYVRQGGKITF